MAKPHVISLTSAEVEALKQRIVDSSLVEQDKTIIVALLSFNFWLQGQLARAKLTILRLKKIFGLPTEKNNNLKQSLLSETATPILPDALAEFSLDTSEQPPITLPDCAVPKRKPVFDPTKNHGRYSASDYTGCARVTIVHDHLKVGDTCPECAESALDAKLYALLPTEIVKLQGTPIITGTLYVCERLRCALCGNQYNASLPDAIAKQPKYDGSCRSAIAIARYYAGLPFKRLETLQKLQGVPLADATQWDQVLKLYQVAAPIHQVLETSAAQGSLVEFDDTGNRVLEAYGDKKAVHTTAFISTVNENLIYLFYTSQRIAGENMGLLMEKRVTDETLLTMTDASAHNMPRQVSEALLARWILCFCLVHGRRYFYEVSHFFPKECEFVLNTISQIYQHEAHCKKHRLNPEQRLAYHQEHSTPLMEGLRIWLNNQLLHRIIESNSGLGEATQYMLRHWIPLTRFLHVAGAPIDNSLCEQSIKVAIRHRRNSLFFKTFKGAMIGDCLTSVIHTAAKNKKNPFDYLNTLQRYAEYVHVSPGDWVPWRYQATLSTLTDAEMAYT